MDENPFAALIPDAGDDPFAALIPSNMPTSLGEKGEAALGGVVRDLPIVGPYLDEGSKRTAAGLRSMIYGTSFADELKAVNDYAKGVAERNPGSALAGGIAGNVGALGGLGSTALGARALGITGGSLLGRGAAGAVSGAAIGAADAAVRGQPVAEGAGIGGLAGAAAPAVASAVGRAVAPFRTNPARQAAVDVLDREGVTLSAGDRTGSRPLRWAESSLGDFPGAGGAAEATKDVQGRSFNRAVLSRIGEQADMANAETLQRASTRIGKSFEDLSARNTLRYDRQFAQDIGRAVTKYDRVLPSQQREVFNNYVDDIIRQQNGSMSGAVYQDTRSRLSTQAKDATDKEFGRALRNLRNALDSAMGRSISPRDRVEWATARRQWGALRTVEKAMSGASERTAQGYIDPSQLRTAISSNDRSAYAKGQGQLTELARSAEAILKKLPQSGTAPRSFLPNLITAITSGGGFAAGGPIGAAAGFLGPGMAGRGLLSAPVQAYLGNQAGGVATREVVSRMLPGPLREAALQALEDEQRRRGQLANK